MFKTEDGTRIFDEHGAEVEDFDPGQIEDWRPKWEQLTAAREQQQTLVDERQQLHDYQTRLDTTRDQLGDEGLTKAELDDLRESLEADMPDAVRLHLPSEEVATPTPAQADLSSSASPSADPAPRGAVAAKLDMPAL